jgi:hypothetical protein
MKTKQKAIIIGIALTVLIFGGVNVYLAANPLIVIGGDKPEGAIFGSQTKVGNAFMSASNCAHRQKGLYGYIEAYLEKHGQVPADLNTLINDDTGSMHFTRCPLGHSYILHAENYGKPNAVFISESRQKHPTAFQLWARGIKPCVQTMGDGTIHMFEGGKIATIQARKE